MTVDFQELLDQGFEALNRLEYDAAAQLLRRAIELAPSDADRALAEMRLAAIGVLQRDLTADLRVFRENVMRRHSTLHVSVAAYYLTIAAIDRGDREAAARYLPVMRDAARELGDETRIAQAYDAAAGAESIRGNHAAAIEYGLLAQEAARACSGEDAAILAATITHNLAYNSLAANQYGPALRYAIDAVEFVAAYPPLHGQALVTAAFAFLCNERLDEALDHIDRAEPLVEETSVFKYVHYVRGEVARRRGKRREAELHFSKLEPLYPDIPSVTQILLSMNVAPFLLPE